MATDLIDLSRLHENRSRSICTICRTTVHSNSKQIKCCLCLRSVHQKCCQSCDANFFCGLCISNCLPFASLEDDDDFFQGVGLCSHTLRSRITELDNNIFNLNPFKDLDKNLINNPDIDVDEHYFNCFAHQNMGYMDTEQLNEKLANKGGKSVQSIMHINARSLVSNIDLVCSNIKLLKTQFSVICVSETWACLSTEQFISIPGYDCICRSRSSRRGGGLALYIDCDLDVVVKNRPDLDSPDATIYESLIVQLSQPNTAVKDIIVGVIYKPPNTNVETYLNTFSIILDILNKEGRPTYLLGDFNIDLLKYNTHSESFLNHILTYGFFPKIDRATRITNTTATLIDNIITNVHDHDLSSGIWIAAIADHLPVFIMLPHPVCRRQPKNRIEQKRIYSTQNFENFRISFLQTDWSAVYDASNTNEKYSRFLGILNRIHNDCFPLMSIKINPLRESKPWISPTILNSVKKKNAMYKQYLTSRTPTSLVAYKKYKNKLTTILRQAEKNCYSAKIIEAKDNIAKTWKIINKMTNKNSSKNAINKLKIGNIAITDPLTIAEKFNDFFVNIGLNLVKKIPHSSKSSNDFLIGDYCNSMFFAPTTTDEILDIINNLKNSNSTGQDNIPIKLIKSCGSLLAPILAEINNQSLTEGVFPDALKIAKVVPILKNGDPTCVSNYRPISVLPAFSKITEKIVYKRLNKYFTDNLILHQSQFGFRENLSTSMALLELVDKLSEALDNKLISIGVFIDLAKAFDTVDHGILLKKLEHHGIRGTVLGWFQSYLSDRKQYVVIDKCESECANISCGVPQGSILGPILFLLYINDLNYVSKLLRTVMFADDTNLFLTGSSLDVIEKQMNGELEVISDWFKANLLSLNITKTSYIIFSNKKCKDVNLRIQGASVTRQFDTKFLGVILSSNLKWNKHLDVILAKISKSIGVISKTRHLLPSHLTRMLYLTMVEPYLNYCSLVWASGDRSQLLDRVLRVQKKFCRLMTFSDFSAPSAPLFRQLHILRIYDIYLLNLATYMFKILNHLIPTLDHHRFTSNSSFHSYQTRNKDQLHTPFCRTKLRQGTICFQGPKLWNQLPGDITAIKSFRVFKNQLKQVFINRQ